MTRYWVRFTVHSTGKLMDESFGSMIERAMFVISMTPWATLVEEWLE